MVMALGEMVCPHCGSALNWRYGLVFHHDYIHVRICNQPSDAKCLQDLASIIKRPCRTRDHSGQSAAPLRRVSLSV